MDDVDDKNRCSVYLFQNPRTLESYVGSTSDDERREKEHLAMLQKNVHPNRKFQAAYNRDPNFDFVSVPASDRNEAYDVEQQILDSAWGNPLLLNLSRDARAGAYDITPETSEKMRRAKLGTKASPETKAKMSASRMGFQFSPESIEKMRQKEITPEFRELMSGIMKGNKHGAGVKRTAESIDQQRQRQLKPVLVEGKVYSSHAEVAEQFGVTATTVTNRIRSEKHPDWRYPAEH